MHVLRTAGMGWLWAMAVVITFWVIAMGFSQIRGWMDVHPRGVTRVKAAFRWIGRTFFRYPASRFVDDPHVQVLVDDKGRSS